MVGLLLAIVGVVVPIIWDLFRSSASLELKQTGRTTIIQRNDSFEKLHVEYDGKPIKELASVRFQLANTGSLPIRDSDLVAPPTVHFPNSHPVLDARIESTFPSNLSASITRGSDPTTVSVTFPLLNPGDNVQYVVLIGQTSPMNFTANARIVGLSKLKVVTQPDAPLRVERQRSWVVYPVGIFSIFLLLGVLVGLCDIPKERRFKKMVRENLFQIPEDLTTETATQFVSSNLSWTTASERKGVFAFLDTLPIGQPLANDERDRLARLMQDCSAAATSNVTMVIVVSIISLVGFSYVLVQFL